MNSVTLGYKLDDPYNNTYNPGAGGVRKALMDGIGACWALGRVVSAILIHGWLYIVRYCGINAELNKEITGKELK